MFRYCNKNPLGKLEDDCVIRAISCATNKSWDYVYDGLSDLAQQNGTMMNSKGFVIWLLDTYFKRVPVLPERVGDIAKMYPDDIVLCTVRGHICCVKFGVIYDTFDPSNRLLEEAWIVKD